MPVQDSYTESRNSTALFLKFGSNATILAVADISNRSWRVTLLWSHVVQGMGNGFCIGN